MNLTRLEAQQAMQQGKKVAHELFCGGEWITSDPTGKTITDEKGAQFPEAYFWGLRSQDHWQTGWQVVG